MDLDRRSAVRCRSRAFDIRGLGWVQCARSGGVPAAMAARFNAFSRSLTRMFRTAGAATEGSSKSVVARCVSSGTEGISEEQVSLRSRAGLREWTSEIVANMIEVDR